MKKTLSILTILLFTFAVTISSCGDSDSAKQCDSATETTSVATDGKCCGNEKGCCSGGESHSHNEGDSDHDHPSNADGEVEAAE
ncbi:MAG: hypothetical protein CMP51_04230 [Flavobacteriales bacterium]|nr:hypothetical protein [Flavobacteriales bacterium]|tara:strand:+ start:277 stop:528 length:252 start_codon:yes stop_codon:yes gene_type:complete